jgi:hypothetical protein
MSTLLENVQKVRQANEDLGNAIASHGIEVPENSRLSEKAGLVKRIPRPSKWGRPADWPRIDLINMYGLDYDVCYLILRKPEDTVNHGFRCNCRSFTKIDGQDSTPDSWFIEQVTVSDDGKTVTPVEGTHKTFASSVSHSFDFPEEDPAGTLYAVRVSTDIPGRFSMNVSPGFSLSIPQGGFYRSGVVMEAIVRSQSYEAPSFSTGTKEIAGPLHVAYYGCNAGIQEFITRAMTGLEYLEMREGTKFVMSRQSPVFACPWTTFDYDDDTVFVMKDDYMTENDTRRFCPDSSGKLQYLDRIVRYDDGQPVDWSNFGVSHAMSGYKFMGTLTLPENYGRNSTSISYAFANIPYLQKVVLPNGFGSNATVSTYTFFFDISLIEVILPDGCASLSTSIAQFFYKCYCLTKIHLPKGFAQNSTNNNNWISECGYLTTITGEPNFKVSVQLSSCPLLTHDSLMVVINGLQVVETKQILTLGTTLLAKLSDDEKKIATDRGWTLA